MQTVESTKTTPALQAKATEEKPFFAPNSRQEAGGKVFFGGSDAGGNGFFKPRSQPVVQAKLTIGRPGDKYEQEADKMAEQVVSRPAVQRQELPPEEGKINRKPLAAEITPLVQRKEEEEKEPEALQRKADDEEPEENLQRQAEQPEEEPLVQAKTEQGSTSAPVNLQSRLDAAKGSGSLLPAGTRSQMENAFGADFGSVRVHTGSDAAGLSKDLNAQAFTHGSDVYFNEGKYRPETTEGRRLLGHELVHVVQQKKDYLFKNSDTEKGTWQEKAKNRLLSLEEIDFIRMNLGNLIDIETKVENFTGRNKTIATNLKFKLDWIESKEKFNNDHVNKTAVYDSVFVHEDETSWCKESYGFQKNGLISYAKAPKKKIKGKKSKNCTPRSVKFDATGRVIDRSKSNLPMWKLEKHFRNEELLESVGGNLFDTKEIEKIIKSRDIETLKSILPPNFENRKMEIVNNKLLHICLEPIEENIKDEYLEFQKNGILLYERSYMKEKGKPIIKPLKEYYSALGEKMSSQIGEMRDAKAVKEQLGQEKVKTEISSDLFTKKVWDETNPEEWIQNTGKGVYSKVEKAINRMIEFKNGAWRIKDAYKKYFDRISKFEALKDRISKLKESDDPSSRLIINSLKMILEKWDKDPTYRFAVEISSEIDKANKINRRRISQTHPARDISKEATAALCNVISFYIFLKLFSNEEIPDFVDWFLQESLEEGRIGSKEEEHTVESEKYYDYLGTYLGAGMGAWMKKADMIFTVGGAYKPLNMSQVDVFLNNSSSRAIAWQNFNNPIGGKAHHYLLIAKDKFGVWRNYDHTSQKFERRGGETQWERVHGLYYQSHEVEKKIDEQRAKSSKEESPPASP